MRIPGLATFVTSFCDSVRHSNPNAAASAGLELTVAGKGEAADHKDLAASEEQAVSPFTSGARRKATDSVIMF